MKTKKVKAQANAKVNLTFEIDSVLESGYHQVSTLLQSVDLVDSVSIEVSPSKKGLIYISSYKAGVAGDFPMDESNLAVKACDLYLQTINQSDKFDVKIKIEKQIPIQAGLAGGSANAAASLVAMNNLFDNQLSENLLLKLGSKLGADIPFCIKGGTCFGTGKGDILEEVRNPNKLNMILVKPRYLSISTPMLFSLYDKHVRELVETKYKNELDEYLSNHPSCQNEEILKHCYSIIKAKTNASITKIATEAISRGDLESFFANLTNHFENIFFKLHPELLLLKEKLLEFGCWTANLTGSGPTIYGTVPDIEKANLIQRKLIADKLNNPKSPYYKHGPLDHWVVVSSNSSAEIVNHPANSTQ